MWEYEHTVETTAAPSALWEHWTDMAAWPSWNAGIETIKVDGPFRVGTTFTMTPPGEDPISMRLTEVVAGERFTQIGPELGPAITADFPEVLAALAAAAEG